MTKSRLLSRSLHVCIFLFGLIVLPNAKLSHAGVLEGKYRGTETWKYLAKFVFNPPKLEESMGKLVAEISFPNSSAFHPSLFLYYKAGTENTIEKEFGLWENAYNSDLTCEEKYQVAYGGDNSKNGGRVFPLTPRTVGSFEKDGTIYLRTKITTHVDTRRPRWVFIAVGNCGEECNSGDYCSSSLDIQYKLTMTNGVENYFSADESWNYPATLGFFIVYSLVVIPYGLLVRHRLIRLRKYHHTVKLLLVSIWFMFATLSCKMIHLGTYRDNGVGFPSLDTFCGFLFSISEFSLLLMSILVAKGWTITRRKISAMGRVRIAVYMTTYICVNWLALIYHKFFVDPAAIVYLYETPPGYVMIYMRLMAAIWLTYATYVTLTKYASKKRFFKKFWFFILLWILSMPILVCINQWLNFWYRAKFVYVMTILWLCIVQIIFTVMYNPSAICHRLNETFPFHATTNDMMRPRSLRRNSDPDVEGINLFSDANLKKAFIISSKIKHSVLLLQSFTVDLHAFLENTQSRKKKYASLSLSQVDISNDIENQSLDVSKTKKPKTLLDEENKTPVPQEVTEETVENVNNNRTSISMRRLGDSEDTPLPNLARTPRNRSNSRTPRKSRVENAFSIGQNDNNRHE